MATVWQPDVTIRPSLSPGAWEADTGGYRATLSGWKTGRPTSVFRHPTGARFSWQADGAAWEMEDGSVVPLSVPEIVTEEHPEKGRMIARGAMGGGIDDEYRIEGGRLKHNWVLPSGLTVPVGARRLLLQGRAFPYGCAFPALTGRSVGTIPLYAPDGAAVVSILRGEAQDEAGNRTHVTYDWRTVGSTSKVLLSVAVDAEWLRVAQGRVTVDPTVVATSTSSAPTAYSNQRKIDRFHSANVLFGLFNSDSGTLVCRYSSDGSTWLTPATGSVVSSTFSAAGGSSGFIDDDDYIHVVYTVTGTVFYRRGTPNAGRTDYTWTAATTIQTTDKSVPDVVAHAEGTGWVAHVVYSFADGIGSYAVWKKVSITSGGVMTVDGSATQVNGTTGPVSQHTYPSVSVDSSKHLYFSWTQQTTGAGHGLRGRKAAYSAGSWTLGTNEAILETDYASVGRIISGIDSAGRLIVAAFGTNAFDRYVYERSTSGVWTSRSPGSTGAVTGWSLAIDTATDNIYLWYTTTGGVWYRKYDRTAGTWGSAVNVDTDATAKEISARRDSSGSAIDVLYTTGSGSPYSVKHYRLTLNTAPTAPTLTTEPNFDATGAQSLAWTFTDPDPSDTQSAYQLQILRVDTGATVVDTTKTASTASTYALAGGTLTNALQYQWRVRCWDASDAEGAWSSYGTFYASAKPTATITVPAVDGDTVSSSSLTAQWSFSDPESEGQASYQVELLSAADAVLWDSTKTAGVSPRALSIGYTLVNATTYKARVTVWDAKDVASTAVVRTFVTSFTVPSVPPFVATSFNDNGYIGLFLSGQGADVASNDIYRRTVGGAWVRIATGVTVNGSYADYAAASGVTYEYKATAIGSNGTSTDSATVSAVQTLTGLWVHDTIDPLTALRVTHNLTRVEEWQADATFFRFAGRSRPVAQFGETTEGRFRADCLISVSSTWETLKALVQRRSTLCLRDSYGRKLYGVISSLPEQDELWGAKRVSLELTEIDHTEAV